MNEKDFMKHVRREIIDLFERDGTITLNNKPKRCNSYERNYLMQYWDNELLIHNTKYYLEHSFGFDKTNFLELDATYDACLKHKLIHMLLERLEMYVKSFKQIDEINDLLIKMKNSYYNGRNEEMKENNENYQEIMNDLNSLSIYFTFTKPKDNEPNAYFLHRLTLSELKSVKKAIDFRIQRIEMRLFKDD